MGERGIMDFVIKIIPHNEQRYDTLDDWKRDNEGVMQIKISDTGNPDFNFLLTEHAIREAYFCVKNGVTEQAVDVWDFTHPDADEPGMLPGCPYKRWHMLAELYERSTCYDLDYDWEEYERAIMKLFKEENA